ncbi:hypothetical protein [Maricaulis sp.]|uniref:hypothetical protein n=1 Tax=Maricaulis sp. TaxID=1486257 RepID=UPI002B265139|nr:hypothetical protein [Maricaulis sp.]
MLPLALFMLSLMTPDSDKATLDGPRSGLYAEIAEDGRSTCLEGSGNQIRLLIAPNGEPPHLRSSNVGELEFRIEGEGDSFVLSATADRWQFGGGRQHTVGMDIGGVTSGFLIGQLTLELAPSATAPDHPDATEALTLIAARYNPVQRGSGRAMQVFVDNGATPDGRPLRPFVRCGS